jgi:1-acyl-sn-glycerol-3-phosphate acyltransferase
MASEPAVANSTATERGKLPPRGKARMKPVYFIGWTYFRIFFRLFCRWEVYNPEHVPLTGPAILASNHASFLDPPLVGAAAPREINYLARETLFRFPVVGSILKSVNAVPVDREGGGAAGLRAIFDRLMNGGAIILFPEGTRSPDGNLQKAKSGIGLTVIKSEAPVVPVRVFGTFDALSRHHSFPRPRKVAVKFGTPMDFAALRAEAKSCSKQRLKEIYQEVADQLMAAIAALKVEDD